MIYNSMIIRKRPSVELNKKLVIISKQHEDLAFKAIQYLTKVIDVVLSHKDEMTLDDTMNNKWDLSEYLKTMGILKKHRIKVMVEVAQNLKKIWLNNDNDEMENFQYTSESLEDEKILGIKLEIYAAVQRVRESNEARFAIMNNKLSRLLGCNIDSIERNPFDVSVIFGVYFNALDTLNLSLKQRLMALGLFEAEISKRLDKVYLKLTECIEEKINADKVIKIEKKLPDESSLQGKKPKFISRKGKLKLVGSYDILNILSHLSMEFLVKKASLIDFKSLVLEQLSNKNKLVVIDVNCDNILDYTKSTFNMQFGSESNEKNEKYISLINVFQFFFVKVCLQQSDVVYNKHHSIKKLMAKVASFDQFVVKPYPVNKKYLSSVFSIIADLALKNKITNDQVEIACIAFDRYYVAWHLDFKKYEQCNVHKIEKIDACSTEPQSNISVKYKVKEVLDQETPRDKENGKLLKFLINKIWYRSLYMVGTVEGYGSEEWLEQIRKLRSLVWSMQDHSDQKDKDRVIKNIPIIIGYVEESLKMSSFNNKQSDKIIDCIYQYFRKKYGVDMRRKNTVDSMMKSSTVKKIGKKIVRKDNMQLDGFVYDLNWSKK